MVDLFSDQTRRDPFETYARLREVSAVCRIPPPFDAWAILDYEGVKRVLNEPEMFSSAVPAPADWFLFTDPPRHTKLRALIKRAFTPRVIATLEPRIRELSRQLLAGGLKRGRIDLAAEFSVPL